MQYDRTQTAPLYLILVGVGITMIVGGWLTPDWIVRIILFCSGGLMFLLALCFRQLTVSSAFAKRLSVPSARENALAGFFSSFFALASSR
jgi:hypothetical protein